MLQTDFIPPALEISQRETARRLKALEIFVPRIKDAVTSLTVTGSMASGQNYAVTEKSDLDLQLTVTKDSAQLLKQTGIFPDADFAKPLTAYLEDRIKQFSFSVEIDGVPHECHFWDEQALIDAMLMKVTETKRIRTSNNSAAIDYGFAFDGSQHAYECPTEEVNGIFISVLPSYRQVDSKLFLCRPVTNWLSTPYILFGEEILNPHIDNVWSIVTRHLAEENNNQVNLNTHNILNSLPSKFKASPEAKNKIMERTKSELDKLGVGYSF